MKPDMPKTKLTRSQAGKRGGIKSGEDYQAGGKNAKGYAADPNKAREAAKKRWEIYYASKGQQ